MQSTIARQIAETFQLLLDSNKIFLIQLCPDDLFQAHWFNVSVLEGLPFTWNLINYR